MSQHKRNREQGLHKNLNGIVQRSLTPQPFGEWLSWRYAAPVSFRDPLESAQLRIEALERENATLRAPAPKKGSNVLFSILVAGGTLFALILIGAFGMGIAKGIERWKATPAAQKTVRHGVVSGVGVSINDLRVGTGRAVAVGDKLEVHYRGSLQNGTEFDSSYARSEPFTFVLGKGQVIKGWEQGFDGMRIGGKRRLTIPPDLGYGSKAMTKIPANSTLVFEVELLGAKSQL